MGVSESPLSMADLRKKMTPSAIFSSEQELVMQAAFIALKLKEKKAASVKGSTRRPDMSNGAAIAELCDLCANTSPLKDTTTNDPSKNESF
ncbi:unnamed protein product [Cylindrotheca closterium]|uniref:Uncharacterized protein n=1 Tax=Cylindrotheca closterium TaxID=2856 RepID=A0AAD2PUL1_9STRA|nr:unnamed protein product [Cylindrotheca closterium]